MRRNIFWALGLMATAAATAADEPATEYRRLDGLADPKRWSPDECELSPSTHAFDGLPGLRMRIPVDFHAGEKQYPVGWPRMYLALKPDEQGWSDYDRLEFRIFTESTRAALPQRPLIFHLYDAQGQKKLVTMDLAAVGADRAFSLNLSDLGLNGPVVRLGFNINEADYCDKDLVDFHLGGFRLARATAARVTELKALAPALFCDSRTLPVELVVEGPPEKLAAGVPFQLRRDGRVALSRTMPVARGRQTLRLPLADTAPGAYTLVVCPDDPALRRETAVLLTSSPWR